MPKTHLPNYGEFYEQRHFVSGKDIVSYIEYGTERVPFGTDLLFCGEWFPEFTVAAEICEDLWVPDPPSVPPRHRRSPYHCKSFRKHEMVGKESYRRNLVKGQSARLVCGYIYSNAGEGESTQDLVFGGQNMIAENGVILAAGKRFENDVIYSEIDVQRLADERRRLSTFPAQKKDSYMCIPFKVRDEETILTRNFPKYPFVPDDQEERELRCEEIFKHPGNGIKDEDGAYPLYKGYGGVVRRIGFHASSFGDSQSF